MNTLEHSLSFEIGSCASPVYNIHMLVMLAAYVCVGRLSAKTGEPNQDRAEAGQAGGQRAGPCQGSGLQEAETSGPPESNRPPV